MPNKNSNKGDGKGWVKAGAKRLAPKTKSGKTNTRRK
jgi:hypothetical protein